MAEFEVADFSPKMYFAIACAPCGARSSGPPYVCKNGMIDAAAQTQISIHPKRTVTFVVRHRRRDAAPAQLEGGEIDLENEHAAWAPPLGESPPPPRRLPTHPTPAEMPSSKRLRHLHASYTEETVPVTHPMQAETKPAIHSMPAEMPMSERLKGLSERIASATQFESEAHARDEDEISDDMTIIDEVYDVTRFTSHGYRPIIVT